LEAHPPISNCHFTHPDSPHSPTRTPTVGHSCPTPRTTRPQNLPCLTLATVPAPKP
jgi:hypothetical protein